MEDLEQELYELQEELDNAEMELYCWEIKVRDLNEEKQKLKDMIEEGE